jgi:Amidohydrolase/Glycine cleavage H-protein
VLRRFGSAVRVGLGGPVAAGLPVRFGQLGGLGHAALGYGEHDSRARRPSTGASRPDLTASRATPVASSCLPRCGQRQGPVEPGQGRAPRAGPQPGRFDRGEHYAARGLRDIVYVSLPVVGATVTAGDPCGEVESTKAISDLSGWSPKYFPPQLVRAANTLLKNKMLFGSDYPLIRPERWIKDFQALEIRDEVKPLIMKENAIHARGLR